MAKDCWTVAAGPRVYHLAYFLGVSSKLVLAEAQDFHGSTVRSASSRLPLPVAFAIAQDYRPECRLVG